MEKLCGICMTNQASGPHGMCDECIEDIAPMVESLKWQECARPELKAEAHLPLVIKVNDV